LVKYKPLTKRLKEKVEKGGQKKEKIVERRNRKKKGREVG
jgi:hypothetical protein